MGETSLIWPSLSPVCRSRTARNFDPTKAGFSSISFGGRFGRTARINVDGIDISDDDCRHDDLEHSGKRDCRVPAQPIVIGPVARPTSSGAVNVTTRSGPIPCMVKPLGCFATPVWAEPLLPAALIFRRSVRNSADEWAVPIIKDKFFFLLRTANAPSRIPSLQYFSTSPFDSLNGGFGQAFRETNLLAKADYNLGRNAHAFYRYTYFANFLPASFGLWAILSMPTRTTRAFMR